MKYNTFLTLILFVFFSLLPAGLAATTTSHSRATTTSHGPTTTVTVSPRPSLSSTTSAPAATDTGSAPSPATPGGAGNNKVAFCRDCSWTDYGVCCPNNGTCCGRRLCCPQRYEISSIAPSAFILTPPPFVKPLLFYHEQLRYSLLPKGRRCRRF